MSTDVSKSLIMYRNNVMSIYVDSNMWNAHAGMWLAAASSYKDEVSNIIIKIPAAGLNSKK